MGVDAYSYLDDGDTTNGVFTAYQPYTGSTGPQTLRLESYASGRQVVSLNGTVLHDYVETGTPFATLGYEQGFWMAWRTEAGRTSPRILSVTGGCLEPVTFGTLAVGDGTFTDDFERADGAIGSEWELVTPYFSGAAPSPFTISDNALIGPGDPTPGNAYAWMRPVTTRPGESQFVECVITGLLQGFSDTSNIQLVLKCQANATDLACQHVWVAGDDPTSTLIFYVQTVGADGTHNTQSPTATLVVDPDDPVTVRMEADADGRARVFINGTMYIDIDTMLDVATTPVPPVGDRQSMYLYWEVGEEAWEFDVVSPRILSFASGGSTPAPPEPEPCVPGTSFHILEVCGGITEIPAYVPGPGGDLLFVLDWATDPSDLDFHMTGPAGPYGVVTGADDFTAPGTFHNSYYNVWPVVHEFLDYDDVTSFGPEYMMILAAHPDAPPYTYGSMGTPTIYRSTGYVPGKYAIWVNLYSGSGSFATSDAVVRMYRMPAGVDELVFVDDRLVVDLAEWDLVDTFRVGDSTGDLTATSSHGPNWRVCDLELTDDSYTVTRIMRIEPGNQQTQVFPD